MNALLIIYLVLAHLTDLVSAAVYAAFDLREVVALRYIRDGLALVLCLAGFVRPGIAAAIRWSALAYAGFIGFYLIAGISGDTGLGLLAGSAAKVLLPVILAFAGAGGIETPADARRVAILVIGLGMASTLFGAWDKANTGFWTNAVEYGDYLFDLKGVTAGFSQDTGLPFNFYGFEDVRRAAGLVAAPLAQGSLLAVAGLVGFAHLRARRPLLAVLVLGLAGFGIYQSGTRGALIILLTALPLHMLLTSRNIGRFWRDALLIALGLAGSVETLRYVYTYTTELADGSTIGHIEALAANLTDLGSILAVGEGLGSAGALAADAGLEIAGGGEGAIFSIAYQIGLPGALAFLAFYAAVTLALFRRRQDPEEGEMATALFALALGSASSLIISEHLLTVSGMASFWVLAGGFMRQPAAASARARMVPAHP